MRTKNLEYFLAVAEDLSFTRAAQRLYISQQALSGHIQRLEEEYGVTLFERKPSLRLTEEGRQMVFYGRQILQSERNMVQAFADISTSCRGTLLVGMSRLRGSVVFPHLYESYHEMHPNISVELVSGNVSDLENLLMHNKLDVYLGLNPAPNPLEVQLPVGKEYISCIFRRSLLEQYYPDCWEEKLAQFQKELHLADLLDLPLITLRPGTRLRTNIDYVLSGQRKPNIVMECDQSTVAYQLAAKGYGAALVSPISQLTQLNALKTYGELYALPLADPPLVSTLYLVYRSDFAPSRHVMDFIQTSQNYLEDYFDSLFGSGRS